MALATAIAAAATIGGAVLSSKSQKKAANQASQTAADNTAANNALVKDIYGQNKATLAPYVQAGNNATSAISALLGTGSQLSPQTAPAQAQYQPQQTYQGEGNLSRVREALDGSLVWRGYDPTDTFVQSATVPTNQPAATATTNPQQQYQQAFDNYKNSTGYQFRLNEGARALDNSYASRGIGQSGAAAKAALQYGQNIASGEFNNYLNALMGQQGVGLSAAGAQAGVSTNFANQTVANNNAAADAAMQAAALRGNANAQMWGGVAGGLKGLFGSSFG